MSAKLPKGATRTFVQLGRSWYAEANGYRDSRNEEFNIALSADGGGVYGEFSIRWIDFSSSTRPDDGAWSMEVFQDGAAVLVKHFMDLLEWFARSKAAMTVDELRAGLLALGIEDVTQEKRRG